MKGLVSYAALLLVCAVPAQATQLTLGASTSGQYDFSPGATVGFVDIAAPSPILGVGAGFFGSDQGNYQLGTLSATAAGPEQNGAFATTATQPFAYTGADGDKLTGLIAWSSVKDGSNFPDLIGTVTYSASGDAAWLANWGNSGTAAVDVTLDLAANSATLDAIATQQRGSAVGEVSAGEILPQPVAPPPPIPEPGSLPLLMTALFGLAWFKRQLTERR
jgi:hypothetical protein